MDENKTELLRLLYTRIGMIMEDASIIALTLGGARSTFEENSVADVAKAAQAISSLQAAAQALQDWPY